MRILLCWLRSDLVGIIALSETKWNVMVLLVAAAPAAPEKQPTAELAAAVSATTASFFIMVAVPVV